MEFSGTIKITDLNDFLNPAENCSVHSSMIKTTSKNTATVSLSDCLACSGCVTSAESVLLEQHSVQKLVDALAAGPVTVSFSQQSVVAMAHECGLSFDECFVRTRSALTAIGASRVVMICEARDLVLEQAVQEFLSRFRTGKLPVICSECPGWVSYAEKKADPSVFPMLSNVKTPMMVQKELLGISDYHVAVMPCYDKKLEAVRDDSVDLVLTTKEMLEYLHSLSFLVGEPQGACEFYSSTRVKTGSLGYAEYIFLRAVQELYGETPEFEVTTTRRRDVLELQFRDLKFCLASGFQNIQNMVRTIKQGKTPYAFIEMMACPSGCLNGGGQPRLTREVLVQLEATLGSYYDVRAPPPATAVSVLREHKKRVKELLQPPPESRDFQPEQCIIQTPHSVERLVFAHQPYFEWEQAGLLAMQALLQPGLADEAECLRYLYHANWDPLKAAEKLVHHVNWMAEWPPYETMGSLVLHILETGGLYLHGVDTCFRPLLVVRPAKLDMFPYQLLLATAVFLLELIKANLLVPGKIENWVMLVDCKGFSRFHIKTARKLLADLSTHYPCRLAQAFLYRAGPQAATLLGFLPPHTSAKFQIITDKCRNPMLALFAPHQLERKYGGTAPNVKEYWPPQPVGAVELSAPDLSSVSLNEASWLSLREDSWGSFESVSGSYSFLKPMKLDPGFDMEVTAPLSCYCNESECTLL